MKYQKMVFKSLILTAFRWIIITLAIVYIGVLLDVQDRSYWFGAGFICYALTGWVWKVKK